LRGTPASLGTSLSAISNMTSYCLNLHGPSIALDTMCSSSLTSVHLACESLRRSECHFAIAGGVNLTTHPHKLLFLKENHFLSSHGACRSFGEGGDGYVPAEGVGAVLLTTLSRARRLGYPIRGVIKGSAINHGGRTAGGTVPNPVAQAEVIADALATAGVNPRSISCVEAHGTGTALGDPIEIQGLASAFGRSTPDRQFCAIGSSKSNIGHAEAAAGIAGLTKLLLQLEHRELFPSLHADRPNPLIPFADTPFRVQSTLAPWERPVLPSPSGPAPQPRRALISAFGASGSNASLVLEEAGDESLPLDAPRHSLRRQVAIVLSARDEVRLGEVVQRLLDRLQDGTLSDRDLPAIAFTLQVGREAMDERLAFVADSLADVVRRLHDLRDGRDDGDAIHRGRVQRNHPAGARWANSASGEAELSSWIESGAMEALAARWVEGMPIDWPRLYPHGTPRRLHLPTYPFARERHWVPAPASHPEARAAAGGGKPSAQRSPVGPVSVPQIDAAPASPEAAPVRLRAAAVASPPPEMPERKTRKVHLPALDGRPTAIGIAPQPSSAICSNEAPPSEAAPATPSAAPDAGPPEEARIREVLMRTLCATLFMDAADIGEDVSFLDLGMDSIIAVQWVKAVNAELGTEIKATVLYDHSTVAALARHLLLMSKTEATPPGFTVTPSPAAHDETPGTDIEPHLPPTAITEPDALRRSLRESLAAVLFMDAADIDDDSVFTDFGLDSIIAVQWIKAVNAAHGTQLKATVLYEQPTLRALAMHLQAVLDAPSTTSPGLPASTDAPAMQAAAAIDNSGATPSRWGDDVAYALAGCENVEITVVELAPGRYLERIAAGSGAPVILLSPMGALATVWMHQLRALSSAGYRAFVFHYPGHGRSDFGMERPGFAEIAEAVLRALPAEEEQTRFHLVGWSMGALIAQHVARAEPARVRSLTLVSAPAHVTDGPSADSTVTVLGHLASDFAAHVPESAQGAPESAFEFIRAPLKLDAAMPYLEETLGFDYGSTASITTETLVLFGAHDQVIAPEHGLLLASEIAHSRYCRHDSGGHYLPLQNAEWFNERLLQFLRETERPRHVGRVVGAAVDGQPA
jgi:3-oxoacyl-(acyl-carrier-protein) synthase/pimeloyl-ACP methyl ester carboxylesterase/acyl carrier protein